MALGMRLPRGSHAGPSRTLVGASLRLAVGLKTGGAHRSLGLDWKGKHYEYTFGRSGSVKECSVI